MRRSNSNLDGRALLCAFHALCTRNHADPDANNKLPRCEREVSRTHLSGFELNHVPVPFSAAFRTSERTRIMHRYQ